MSAWVQRNSKVRRPSGRFHSKDTWPGLGAPAMAALSSCTSTGEGMSWRSGVPTSTSAG
ncbi:MAG: hypothetical protein MUC96_15055 [Myxococcaceae bacterium]|nr:hypothetical protein [Myxococcaceae bacterium]